MIRIKTFFYLKISQVSKCYQRVGKLGPRGKLSIGFVAKCEIKQGVELFGTMDLTGGMESSHSGMDLNLKILSNPSLK